MLKLVLKPDVFSLFKFELLGKINDCLLKHFKDKGGLVCDLFTLLNGKFQVLLKDTIFFKIFLP